MIIDGTEYLRLKDFIRSGRSHYSHHVSLIRAIKTLGFPGKKLGRTWYIDLKEADLWLKRRMGQEAS